MIYIKERVYIYIYIKPALKYVQYTRYHIIKKTDFPSPNSYQILIAP